MSPEKNSNFLKIGVREYRNLPMLQMKFPMTYNIKYIS